MANMLLILCLLLFPVPEDPGVYTPPPTPTQAPTPTPTPAPTMAPTSAKAAGGLQFGLPGQIQCYNCAPFSVKVHLTNYDPMAGEINCYDYHDGYCWSPTASGIHWKAVWGFSAACPPQWPYGTWVDIPTVGAFVCLDRGGAVLYNPATGAYAVDILGPPGPWVLGTFDATIWVPLNPK